MKKAVLLAAITLGVLILGTAGWWGYQYVQYRQHLPTLDLVVNDVAREYHIYVPRTDSKDEFALVDCCKAGTPEVGGLRNSIAGKRSPINSASYWSSRSVISCHTMKGRGSSTLMRARLKTSNS